LFAVKDAANICKRSRTDYVYLLGFMRTSSRFS